MSSQVTATAAETRLSALDRALDGVQPSQQLTDELFAVVDLLAGEPALRRALTDPGRTTQERGQLATRLLQDRIGPEALHVVQRAVGMRWASGRSLEAALERQGVRAELSAARAAGTVDEVEEQLFRFARIVAANGALRDALADVSAPLTARQELVERLLAGRSDAAAVRLARRAVLARERTFGLTIEHYLSLAAALRQRIVAHVTVARELPADQAERLRTSLARQVGRDVDLQVDVDPAVIGGVRVQLGDEVIEGTVAGRLADVRRQLG